MPHRSSPPSAANRPGHRSMPSQSTGSAHEETETSAPTSSSQQDAASPVVSRSLNALILEQKKGQEVDVTQEEKDSLCDSEGEQTLITRNFFRHLQKCMAILMIRI